MMQNLENRPGAARTVAAPAPLEIKGEIRGEIRGEIGGDPRTPPAGSTGRSRRVLPGLILFAGLALAGCGDDSSTTTPAPAPAPPPAPAAPAPVGVPAGLAVTETEPGFLQFSWEAVEGATGYEIQLSLKEGDFSEVVTAMVTTTTHRFPIAAETTGHARVRALEGDRQSEWSGAVSGTSAAAPVPPLTLAAPMPMVSDSGPDFIEWSWAPVENAAVYLVNVAGTMEGLETAEIQFAPQPRHREEGVDPETTLYLRVRATGGEREAPVLGDWSEAVSGMSDAAPLPFVVEMTPPEARTDSGCSGQALCPDAGTDPEKAMAGVNPLLSVTSSHAASVSPMFVAEAPAVQVAAGEDLTPFAHVNWNLLQSAALADGAVFEFRRMAGGAGQEATPTGEARYITCGPFRCSEAAAEAPAAPEIVPAEAATCQAFSVDFRAVKGIYANRHAWIGQPGGSGTSFYERLNTGVDLGWLYTLSHPATLTHEFTTIAAATPTGTMTVRGKPLRVTSTPLPLDLTDGADTPAERGLNWFGPPANRDGNRHSQARPGPIRNGANDCIAPTGIHNDLTQVSYESVGRSRRTARPRERPVARPRNCFRLITDGLYTAPPNHQRANLLFEDYLPGYRLHVDPQVGVSWAGSRVDWGEEDPFEALQCDRVTFEVAEQVDVCGDFRTEAAAFWGKGLGAGGNYRVEFRLEGDDNATGRLRRIVVANTSSSPTNFNDSNSGAEYRPPGSRHQHLWLVNDLPGIPGNTGNMAIDGTQRDFDLYETSYNHGNDWVGARSTDVPSKWRPVMTLAMLDDDDDPIHGDFGKIDMARADGTPGSDGVADNYEGDPEAERCTDADGGAGCDAEMDFDLSGTFTRIADTDFCTYDIEVSLTCTWDADGDGRRAGDTVFFPTPGNTLPRAINGQNNFIECEVR